MPIPTYEELLQPTLEAFRQLGVFRVLLRSTNKLSLSWG